MKKYLYIALLCSCAGGSSRGATRAEVNQTHEHACTAKGLVVIAEGLSLEQACEEIAPKLQKLLSTDEDCLAYMGDAGPSGAELCSLVFANDKKDGGR